MSTDERMGLPSASEYHRIAACPGYLSLKAQVKTKEKPSADAESGTRIAAAMASRSPEDLAALSYEEMITFEKLVAGREKILAAIVSPSDELVWHDEEKRIFLETAASGKPYFSGKPDAVLCYKSSDTGKHYAIIIDDKSGRNDVEEAAGNMQLRALAVLVEARESMTERNPIEKIFVAINQPFAAQHISIAEYDTGMVQHAWRELLHNLRRSEEVKELTIPGPHCDYCKARGDCSKGQQQVVVNIASAPLAVKATTEQLSRFLVWCDEAGAEKTIEAARDEMKRRIEAGEVDPQWEVKPGRTMEAITDPELVFTRCSEAGIDYKAFLKAVKIGKGSLQDVLADSLKLKGKAVKAKLDEVLAGAVTESISAPSLKRKKP